jgi:hypothetical protein
LRRAECLVDLDVGVGRNATDNVCVTLLALRTSSHYVRGEATVKEPEPIFEQEVCTGLQKAVGFKGSVHSSYDATAQTVQSMHGLHDGENLYPRR